MLSEDELAGVPLLVFCNKQDIEGALKPEGISEKLGLAGGETKREWSVRGSCATKGEGLEEGLDWYVLLLSWRTSLPLFPHWPISIVHAETTPQAGECNTEEIMMG
jgi:signal recognition particle receptor subunit beta